MDTKAIVEQFVKEHPLCDGTGYPVNDFEVQCQDDNLLTLASQIEAATWREAAKVARSTADDTVAESIAEQCDARAAEASHE